MKQGVMFNIIDLFFIPTFSFSLLLNVKHIPTSLYVSKVYTSSTIENRFLIQLIVEDRKSVYNSTIKKYDIFTSKNIECRMF